MIELQDGYLLGHWYGGPTAFTVTIWGVALGWMR